MAKECVDILTVRAQIDLMRLVFGVGKCIKRNCAVRLNCNPTGLNLETIFFSHISGKAQRQRA